MIAAFALLVVLAVLLLAKGSARNLKRRALHGLAKTLFVLGSVGLLAVGSWSAIASAATSYGWLSVGLFTIASIGTLALVWYLRRSPPHPGPGGMPPDF